MDDYVREVRPLLAPRPRTLQLTVYRPAALSVRRAAAGAGSDRPRRASSRVGRRRGSRLRVGRGGGRWKENVVLLGPPAPASATSRSPWAFAPACRPSR